FDKDRTDTDEDEPSLQEEVQAIVNDVNLGGQNTLQIINNQGRILGTNGYNQDIVRKKITDEIIQKGIKSGNSADSMYIRSNSASRVLLRDGPLSNNDNEIAGGLYLETSLANVDGQLANINDTFLKG